MDPELLPISFALHDRHSKAGASFQWSHPMTGGEESLVLDSVCARAFAVAEQKFKATKFRDLYHPLLRFGLYGFHKCPLTIMRSGGRRSGTLTECIRITEFATGLGTPEARLI
jgi:hypothetical protein